ncbi:hypothetical protein IWX63_003287 [Arthrobacter sp. CAN_A2]|uniref:hypothetical protein n=1 Tax=Arthrobacter sp. CAN_A2 TaxID=2787718 RepID=UPI0018F057D4
MTTGARNIHDALVLDAAAAGILFFWLLLEGDISQGLATVAIPLCFVTVVVTVLSAVLQKQRK